MYFYLYSTAQVKNFEYICTLYTHNMFLFYLLNGDKYQIDVFWYVIKREETNKCKYHN